MRTSQFRCTRNFPAVAGVYANETLYRLYTDSRVRDSLERQPQFTAKPNRPNQNLAPDEGRNPAQFEP